MIPRPGRLFRAVVLLLVLALLAPACGVVNMHRPSALGPTLVDRSKTHAQDPTKSTWTQGSPSDRNVLEFTNDLKVAMRDRMSVARIARLFSGTFQVLTAAAAAALASVTSAGTAVVALAGASAITPEVQSIFDARGSAEAYRQGVELIERAEARYFLRRARVVSRHKDLEVVPSTTFTVDAARLYREALASLKVTEKALIAQIPTIEELERATGRARDALSDVVDEATSLDVKPDKLSLVVGGEPGTLVVRSEDNVAMYATSSEPDVVGVSVPTGGSKTVTVTAKKAGNAHITVVSDKGRSDRVDVHVASADVNALALVPRTLSAGERAAVTVAVGNAGRAKVTKDAIRVVAELRSVDTAQKASWDISGVKAADWGCVLAAAAPAAQQVTCTSKNDLDVGAVAPHLDLIVDVPADFGAGTLRVVTKAVVGTAARETGQDVAVTMRHGLGVKLAATPALPAGAAVFSRSQPRTFTVTATNSGPSAARHVTVTLETSGPIKLANTPTASGWTCQSNPANTEAKCTLPLLPLSSPAPGAPAAPSTIGVTIAPASGTAEAALVARVQAGSAPSQVVPPDEQRGIPQ